MSGDPTRQAAPQAGALQRSAKDALARVGGSGRSEAVLRRHGISDRTHEGRVPAGVGEVLSQPGATLEGDVRREMEGRFGHDFSAVRIHTDAAAARSAAALDARAYTVGNRIVFGEGGFAPHAQAGRRLLAHELTHVVQQQGASVPQARFLKVGSAGDPAEREAETVADAIAGGGYAGPIGAQPVALARDGTGSGGGSATPAAPATPTVALGNFRNSGSTSTENNCPLCPKTLGVGASSGTNIMEIRGDITGHVTGAQYDIKRTKERGTWKKVGTAWTQLSHVGPGADDDSHNDDEDLSPENNHIYVIDTPGWDTLANPTGDNSATEAVYKASFTETCNVKVGTGSWAQSSNSLNWHSITWLEKAASGSWQRKAGASEIATGSTTVGTGDP